MEINNDYVIKGKYIECLRKVVKPNQLAIKYYKNGIDEIIFLDAVKSLYDRNFLTKIINQACQEIFVHITVEGGIRILKDIQNALNAGAEKVSFNSQAFRDNNFYPSGCRNIWIAGNCNASGIAVPKSGYRIQGALKL